jgi:hypothetical protein
MHHDNDEDNNDQAWQQQWHNAGRQRQGQIRTEMKRTITASPGQFGHPDGTLDEPHPFSPILCHAIRYTMMPMLLPRDQQQHSRVVVAAIGDWRMLWQRLASVGQVSIFLYQSHINIIKIL